MTQQGSSKDLPGTAEPEEAAERSRFLHKVEAGIRQVEAGQVLTHDEVKCRLRPLRHPPASP